MTAFYKVIENGYITGIGTNGPDTVEAITEEEYRELRSIIHDAPHDAPVGYAYMLRADTLTWELVELPPEPDAEAEISDYEQELADLGVRFE